VGVLDAFGLLFAAFGDPIQELKDLVGGVRNPLKSATYSTRKRPASP